MTPGLAAHPAGAPDTTSQTVTGVSGGGEVRTRSVLPRWAIVVALLVVMVGAAAVGGAWWNATRTTPADSSVEAGFARDMQTHHAQAVQMAMIVRDKTSDPTLRALSYDIVTTQQQQIGQMYAWLTVWHLPQTSSQAPMAWMNDSPSGHTMPMSNPTSVPGSTASMQGSAMGAADGQMPGMAAPADLQRLQQATGLASEIQFLQLMIAHHQGGVAMAQGALDRTSNTEVTTLARAIVTGQQAEIDQMRQLLQARQTGN